MRLITRSDFDGLACAVLLEEIGLIDDYKFVHPKDVQDGLVTVTDNDILANVPYVDGAGYWFDHHSSEEERLEITKNFEFKGAVKAAPSCARVIYDYFGGAEKFKMFDQSGLMKAVDKADAARFTAAEIMQPEGWVLLSFVMDPRTGLGRYHDYRISNLDLMRDMIKYCRTMKVEDIIKVSDVEERVKRYFDQEPAYEMMLRGNSHADGNVIIIDLRPVDEILSGNRFIEYAIYPEQNVSVRIIWGKAHQNVVITVGHSILNRTCQSDVGSLMLKYGGGGHKQVGTCQIPTPEINRAYGEIVEALKNNG
ncbi:MAG: exopolyphosphatase [Proteobacteria bacterium]|nr:exopolyphosphatase [Pseudomonadota bacterium]